MVDILCQWYIIVFCVTYLILRYANYKTIKDAESWSKANDRLPEILTASILWPALYSLLIVNSFKGKVKK